MLPEQRKDQVTLGCGTLILIALIVMFFSRPGIEDLQREVHTLRSDVGELKKTIQDEANEIKLLREQLEKAKPKAADRIFNPD